MEENLEITSAMTPVEQKEQEIRNLEADLTSTASPIGDWKVSKYMEYQALGIEAPYDIYELHEKRQAVRDRINALELELAQTETGQEG